MEGKGERSLCDLVFVGFNSRVVALDRTTGEKVWRWKTPGGSGLVAVLLAGYQLIASCDGYPSALPPLTGVGRW